MACQAQIPPWALSCVTSLAAASCDPCCVNDCSRSYWLVDDHTAPPQQLSERLRVANLGEAANECEISDRPRSADPGAVHWLVEVTAQQGTGTAVNRVRALETAPASSPDCEPLMKFQSVGELLAAEVQPNQQVCLSAEVHVELACTQVACSGP